MGDEGTSGQHKSATGRLLSIDALRGFDMFWIAGGEGIVEAGAHWTSWEHKDRVAEQWQHVDWAGFRFYDLIFPLFLFLVGVVLPFSLGKLRQQGQPAKAIYGRVFRRTLLLFFLGLLFNHFMRFDFSNLRVTGVLQRIALCYLFAALIMLNTRIWGQVLAILALLLGYWALLAYVPAPESGITGDYSKQTNLAGYIDRHYLPGRIIDKYYGYGDNEGILSTVPSIATALLGVLAGHWLLSNRSQTKKVLGLVAAGVFCLAGGYAWSGGDFWGHAPALPERYQFPIIKNIWTSSFVLFAGGWSFLLLALFYWVIDVLGFRKWAFFFAVIGANAILIYIAKECVDFDKLADYFLSGVIKYSGSWLDALANRFFPWLVDNSHSLEPVVRAIAIVAVAWVCLWFLYRRKIFLRV
jgi:predicted acyltransferase